MSSNGARSDGANAQGIEMTVLIATYCVIAVLTLGISLLTTRSPRSIALIGLAAALWPVSLSAVAAHALLFATRSAGSGSGEV